MAPLLSLSGTLSPLVSLLSVFTTTFLHIFFHNDESTGQAELMRSMEDSQAVQGSAEGVLCLQAVSLDGSNPDGSKMDGWR